jgi:acyl carrier protein
MAVLLPNKLLHSLQGIETTIMTENEALQMIADIFDTPVTDITLATLRVDILAWDSMGFLALMAEFDDRFGILLTPAVLEKMIKVDDILQILRDHNHLTG